MQRDTPKSTEPPLPEQVAPHTADHLFRSLQALFASYWLAANVPANEHEPNAWQDYYALLRTCQDILNHAPMHPTEVSQIDVEHHLEHALEALATTLSHVMPGGLEELEGYVVTRIGACTVPADGTEPCDAASSVSEQTG